MMGREAAVEEMDEMMVEEELRTRVTGAEYASSSSCLALGRWDTSMSSCFALLLLASLSSTMKIPWPANYLSLFRFQSLVSSAGEEFVDLQCTIGDVPIAYVEYGKAAAYAILPFSLVLASFLVWCTCGRCCVQKEKRNAMMTGTITLLLYLV